MPQSRYQQRLLAGACAWSSGCTKPLADGSAYCERHRRRRNRLNSESVNRARDARRAAGLCPYCPGDKPAKLTSPETSCTACKIRRRQLTSVKTTSQGDREARIAAATRKGEDGRTRYHGQGKRGNQPRIQLDHQDLEYAKRMLEAGEVGLDLYEQAVANQAPRIQREDIKSASLHNLAMAQGHIEDVLERRGFFKGHFDKKHGRRDGE